MAKRLEPYASPDEPAEPASNGGGAKTPERGIDFASVAAQASQPDADLFHLLWCLASPVPPRRRALPPRRRTPISHHGNVNEIIGKLGGADQLRIAVNQLQSLLYAA